MPDHPQTATERFLRHGVAGGWLSHYPEIARERYATGEEGILEMHLLDPALWEAAGRSLGWGMTDNPMCKWLNEWEFYWHGLLDHLAAHPGDVDGYLATLLDAKETE